MAFTTQTGLRNVNQVFDSVDLFRGIIKLDDENIAQYNPMITGYGMFFWTKMPPFMLKAAPEMTRRFKNLTEKGCTGFSGINDLQVQTEDMTGGIAGNSFKVVANAKDEFDTFSMKVYELQGSPIREALEFWLTGVRDPKSGWAHYHGVLGSPEIPEYSAKYHTGELIYIQTDPTGGFVNSDKSKNGIEYACLITNILPTKVPKDHVNITHGEHNLVTLDLEMTGVKYESTEINKYAVDLMHQYRKIHAIENYLNYKPGRTSLVEPTSLFK